MNAALWNIDHPETGTGSSIKQKRFDLIVEYLIRANCDLLIITEANAAIQLPGYKCKFSAESPFRSSGRYYEPPNKYYQVAIYSKNMLQPVTLTEPVNGLRCKVSDSDFLTEVYGNVITIKDQWKKESTLKYTDRLNEQIRAIRMLPKTGVLVAGDFNLRSGWPQKKSAHRKVREELKEAGWIWPTEYREDTVQHVLHSENLKVELTVDHSVTYKNGKKTGLSDHPCLQMRLY